MKNILKIALPLPNDLIFDYMLPEYLSMENIIGRRALVPLGKRIITGYIVGISQCQEEIKKLLPIVELLDEEPVFTQKILEFTKWISEYYMCSWGDVLKAALPQGMSPKSMLKVKLTSAVNEEVFREMEKKAPKRYTLLKLLKEHNDFISVSYLEKFLQTSSVGEQLIALEKTGFIICERVIDESINKNYRKAIRLGDKLKSNEEEFRKILDEFDKKNSKHSLLLSWLYFQEKENNETIFISDIIKSIKVTQNLVNTLAKKGYVEIYEAVFDRSKKSHKDNLIQKDEREIRFTVEQDYVLSQIYSSVEEKNFKTILLHGITGSGKTLIYIHAINKVINKGRTALVLVPEISLTPQLIDRFETFFPNNISVLHSRQTPRQRFDSWNTIFSGKSKVVIGARSAIFAPLKNCGLIVVDEEHEPSYKQDSSNPRYNARDCAVIRGKIENAIVILGSATPSIESMHNAHSGKYQLLTLKERADGAKLPLIKIVDTLEARKTGQMISSISKQLYDAIIQRLEKKEGVILFQNRRGFSSFIECIDCGTITKCKNCDVTLTYHKKKNQLRCHYCGWTIPSFDVCKVCGGTNLKEIGTGTQRIEDELRELLAKDNLNASIERFDLDTTTKAGAHRRILHSFLTGQTDILVGTQMVAKGLDFERVTLVGVINADLQLFIPDFRAAEKTFQLLTQVSGRAGRSSNKPGEVIIQTSHPESYAIASVMKDSYESFYNEEIYHRKNAIYPPYSRFVYIEFYGKKAELVNEHAYYFYQQIPQNNNAYLILGPNNPTIQKIKNNYRKIILIKDIKSKDPQGKLLRKALTTAYENYRKKYKSQSIKVIIDIDSFSSI